MTQTRQIILDTETTGLDPLQGHRLTEIGCLEMINRRLTGRKFQRYLNPEREVEAGAVAISGLTTEFLRDKPKFSAVVEEFLVFLQEPNTELIIHNAPFDLGFLNHELGLLQHPLRPLETHFGIIDTLLMARRLHPGQRNNLDALCARYKIDNTQRQYHGALLDSELLAKIYLAMTAGQIRMQLDTEEQHTDSVKQVDMTLKPQRVTRTQNIALSVIRANEEECQRHTERMAAIQK